MNGIERAEQHFQAFQAWVSSKADADFTEMVLGGRLNRGEVCRECGFGRSVLAQNPRVKEGLRNLEARLRATGVLPPIAATEGPAPLRQAGQMLAAADAERLKRLELENGALRVEVDHLREKVRRLEAKATMLADNGRFVR